MCTALLVREHTILYNFIFVITTSFEHIIYAKCTLEMLYPIHPMYMSLISPGLKTSTGIYSSVYICQAKL